MRSRALLGYFFVFFLAGCVPDDQTSIKPEHLSVADPAPVARDGRRETFRENNARHKIVVAVFDTGIDYNHPYLRDHVHFELDASGTPIGAGLDFLTNEDHWASPRLIETSAYEFAFLSEKQKKTAIDNYKTKEVYDNHVRREKMGRVCSVSEMLKLDARLERFIHPYRSVKMEKSRTRHGTHVAGLMTYDNPAIGIIPYRVIPYHETMEDEANFAMGKADKFVGNFEKALAHARRNGVKIVNLSLGGSFEKPTNAGDSSYEENLEKFNNYKRLITEGLTAVVKRYPEILFVAAAGNDSGWSDNEARLQYPCGIEAPNMLCVGALNKDGTLARFTNIPLNKVDLVLASGVKVISTIPADNCDHLTQMVDTTLAGGTNGAGMCRYDLDDKKWKPDASFIDTYRPLVATLFGACARETEMFEPMSGTSMATPIVSHLAAEVWLEHPAMQPTEIIQTLKRRAHRDESRQFTAYSLKAKLPSWYKLFRKPGMQGPANDRYLVPDDAPAGDVHGVAAPEEADGFEFFVGRS